MDGITETVLVKAAAVITLLDPSMTGPIQSVNIKMADSGSGPDYARVTVSFKLADSITLVVTDE